MATYFLQEAIAAHLRRKPWTQPISTNRLRFGTNKRSLAYSKAKGFSTPVACYRRKRSQRTRETETLSTLTFTSATAYEMSACYKMNEL